MNNVINRYLIFGYLKTILNAILIFVCLGVILNLFEEIEFFKNLDIGIGLPLLLTMLFIPNLIIQLLPFVIFLASMWYLISIKSNRDLLSLKIFGFSSFKITSILALTAFIFGIVILFAINPITSVMIKYYEQTKANYSMDIDHLVSINKNGVWIKEINEKNLHITTASKLEENFLFNVTIYKLDQNNKILERMDSNKVNISTNLWHFDSVNRYYFSKENKQITEKNFKLKSAYNTEKLRSLYKNLDTVSFVDLLTDYKKLNNQGYSKEILNERINVFFSLPVFLLLMVVLASIFTVGSHSKKPQNIYYIFISIVCCVVIFYFKDLSIALGQTDRIPLTLSVWMPIIAISLFCLIGVIQINEK